MGKIMKHNLRLCGHELDEKTCKFFIKVQTNED